MRASGALVVLSTALLSSAGAPAPARAADDAPGGKNPPTAATRRTPTAEQIAELIHQLGDRDFRVRERATRALWAAGPAAEPALRKALADADPETARRLRTVLSNLAYGVTPDMSPEVIELVGRYRGGDGNTKRQAVDALGRAGAAGARVLLKLRDDEPDAGIRADITALLLRESHALAVTLIADGDADSAERLLADAAASGDADEQAARDYAALLLVRGKLAERIAELKARVEKGDTGGAGGRARRGDGRAEANVNANANEMPAANAAFVLAFLHRAAGDPAAARAAAERSGLEQLQWNTLVEAGDWKELARRSAATEKAGQADLTSLCFGTAFHRLAGDEAGADRFALLLKAAADREPDDSWNAAEGLLLSGHVDEGLEVLVKHNHLAAAVDFQTQRMAFDEVPALVARARAVAATGLRDGELGEVEAKAVRATWFTGDVPATEAQLEAVKKTAERRRDLPALTQVVGVAAEIGTADRARWYTIAAMQAAQLLPRPLTQVGAPSELTELFTQARFRDAARAAGWWQILRHRFPRDPAGKTLDTLRAIDEGRMPAADLLALCDASAEDAAERRPAEMRDARLELIGDTLAAFGRRAEASARYVQLAKAADGSSPDRATSALRKLAGFDADAGNWRGAADLYHQAWARDRSDPVPLFLAGWALKQAGDAANGEREMAKARLIPLGNEDLRYALYEAMSERKLAAEARRERDAILRTADFLSWRRSEALRRAGDEAHADGDALEAAELWEQAFLDNNSAETRFVEPWANVSMPSLVRRTRAVGLIRAGKVEDGLREADAALAMSPGDADGLIEVVNALDAAGQTPRADALYRRLAGRYAELCKRYPNSGPLHNLSAWAAAKCRRELDAALKHATRAVELQPTNTASLDTLAETHFQRGDVEQALTVMQKCAELEPDDAHHKSQLERFRKALAEKAAKQGAATGKVTPAAPAPARGR